jgi:predicted N-acetyltransferase YhbS
MTTADGSGTAIRQAQATDLDAILDLLTEYDLPRAYFEPFYRGDPTYRPEHSWVAEQDGRLAAHLRVYDRWIRIRGTRLRVAGVGNVITARAYRGRGLAGLLLQATLAGMRAAGFPYSLLWTHLPALYARYGWATLQQQLIEAVLPRPSQTSAQLAPFQAEDLPAVMQIYDATNAARTGPVLRSPEYWRGQLGWLGESRDGFVLARTPAGELLGYVRSRRSAVATEILELGLPPAAHELGRTLLSAVATPTNGRLQGHLPPSLAPLIPDEERETVGEMGMMGRVVDLAALLRTLGPLWRAGLQETALPPGGVVLVTSGGCAAIRGDPTGLQIDPTASAVGESALNESELAHLLFRGFDEAAEALFDGRPEGPLLRVLFPVQDFVFWQADAF